MKFRKLRIAWSAAWGLVAVLLCVLWVRSYSKNFFWESSTRRIIRNYIAATISTVHLWVTRVRTSASFRSFGVFHIGESLLRLPCWRLAPGSLGFQVVSASAHYLSPRRSLP